MAAVISLCGWSDLQHYKDRSPPWVKLYRELLTSESWALGTDTSRLVQVASMLLAARYGNQIPYRWSLLKKVTSLDCTEVQFRAALLHLVEYKFLEIHEVTSPENSVLQDASKALANCYAREEESRGEKRESRGEKNHVELKLDVGPAERVFEHWSREHRHPQARLDPKRRRAIAAALKAFSEQQLCESITGYRNSPHHMGENERRTVYDSIELFLRDATHIEAGLQFARGPPKPQMSAVERAREKLRNGSGNGRVVSEQFSGPSEPGLGAIAGVLRRLPDS